MKAKKFEDLKKEIVDAGFCTRCGACMAFCNKIALGPEPALVSQCVFKDASAPRICPCYAHCPMVRVEDCANVFGETSEDPYIGLCLSVKSARSKNSEILRNAQDGGVVTSLLTAALKKGVIDAAIVVCRDRHWHPVPKLIFSHEELKNTCGATYTPAPVVSVLGEALKYREDDWIRRLAVVGVPCQINALRNLEYGLLYNNGFSAFSDLKIYALGLFCSGVFDYEKLWSLIGIETTKVKKMDIKSEVIVNGGEIKKPLSKIKEATLPACNVCTDFTSELADISIGSMGSYEGWSTLMLRSGKGREFLRKSGFLDCLEIRSNVDEKAIHDMAVKKKKRALMVISKKKNRGMPLPPVIYGI
jgi:coenzyme F420 hydrogenase subunit beta